MGSAGANLVEGGWESGGGGGGGRDVVGEGGGGERLRSLGVERRGGGRGGVVDSVDGLRDRLTGRVGLRAREEERVLSWGGLSEGEGSWMRVGVGSSKRSVGRSSSSC